MSSMLRKKEAFTIITPIPGFIPRQLAIDILHSHSEVITLNPLVLDHKPIRAPRDAASDEYYSTWYEIQQRIQYIPGLGRMGSGRISFPGCFHDMPWGLQTHVYAPMNVDLRNCYRVAGNQPGVERPEPLEMGLAALGAPADGLYLRNDVEIRCNVAVAAFVRSQLRAASRDMVDRIIKKAELLDAGVLLAMMDNGKLRTVNPNDRSAPPEALSNAMRDARSHSSTAASSPCHSPSLSFSQPQFSPLLSDRTGATSPDPKPYHIPRPASYQQYSKIPGSMTTRRADTSHNTHWSAPHSRHQQQQPNALNITQEQKTPPPPPPPPPRLTELPTATSTSTTTPMPVEMPGDYAFAAPQPSPGGGSSTSSSPGPNDWRWSHQSQRSTASSEGPLHSPSPGLPTHSETSEEHEGDGLDQTRERSKMEQSKSGDGRAQQQKVYRPYNPAEYAEMIGRSNGVGNGYRHGSRTNSGTVGHQRYGY